MPKHPRLLMLTGSITTEKQFAQKQQPAFNVMLHQKYCIFTLVFLIGNVTLLSFIFCLHFQVSVLKNVVLF